MAGKKKEKPKHLGRGLQSLLGPITSEQGAMAEAITVPLEQGFPPDTALDGSLSNISVESILPNPYQPRSSWNEEELSDLAESIKTNGLIQPIIVRAAGAKYELIAGERRFRAALQAGLSSLPALVRQANDAEMLELALIENIHRADLNPLERATAYRQYLDKFTLTQTAAAERLGEDRSVIANHLRLLELPKEIKQMLVDGALSMGHARAILALPTDDLRRRLANRAMAGRLSVRSVEQLVRRQLAGSSPAAPIPKPAHIQDLENKIRSQLGTKVNISTHKNGQRGRIVIEFYSLDEFEHLTQKLGIDSTTL